VSLYQSRNEVKKKPEGGIVPKEEEHRGVKTQIELYVAKMWKQTRGAVAITST